MAEIGSVGSDIIPLSYTITFRYLWYKARQEDHTWVKLLNPTDGHDRLEKGAV